MILSLKKNNFIQDEESESFLPNFEQYFPIKGEYSFKKTAYMPINPVKGNRELENILEIEYDDSGSLLGYPPNQCIRKITKVW